MLRVDCAWVLMCYFSLFGVAERICLFVDLCRWLVDVVWLVLLCLWCLPCLGSVVLMRLPAIWLGGCLWWIVCWQLVGCVWICFLVSVSWWVGVSRLVVFNNCCLLCYCSS